MKRSGKVFLWIGVCLLAVTMNVRAQQPLNGQREETKVHQKIAAEYTIVAEDIWYGYHRVKFDFHGLTAWVVEPNVAPAKGKPWTWTMQWAEAFVDRTGVLDLLAEGWHHVTIEAYDGRADDATLPVMEQFQKFLVKDLKFAKKAKLVGMSWGGFFSIRYANAYPKKVARIYLDAPLLNFDGFGDGTAGSIGSWASNKPADGSWSSDPRMPVNMAASIAKARIPVLLLYGGKDEVVNPALNCERFIERFRKAGGNIKVERRAEFGHHPHGLDPDKTDEITAFFKKK